MQTYAKAIKSMQKLEIFCKCLHKLAKVSKELKRFTKVCNNMCKYAKLSKIMYFFYYSKLFNNFQRGEQFVKCMQKQIKERIYVLGFQR